MASIFNEKIANIKTKFVGHFMVNLVLPPGILENVWKKRTLKVEKNGCWMLRVLKCKGITNPKNKDFQFWQQNNHPIV